MNHRAGESCRLKDSASPSLTFAAALKIRSIYVISEMRVGREKGESLRRFPMMNRTANFISISPASLSRFLLFGSLSLSLQNCCRFKKTFLSLCSLSKKKRVLSLFSIYTPQGFLPRSIAPICVHSSTLFLACCVWRLSFLHAHTHKWRPNVLSPPPFRPQSEWKVIPLAAHSLSYI